MIHDFRWRALTALSWMAATALFVACGGSTDAGVVEQQGPSDGGATGGNGGSGTSTTGSGGSAGSISTSGAGGASSGTAGSSPAGTGGTSAAGGSSGSGGSGGASSDGGPASCDPNFKSALIKDCQTEADCVLVRHSDCCGTVVIAVKKGTEAVFTAAEAAYKSCVPGCGQRGCFHADWAEDMTMVASVGQSIVAVCLDKMCMSTVK